MGQSGTGDKIRMVLGCAGWVAGLLIAGSDNPFMPWPNIAGLVLFFISSLGLSASLEKLDRKRRSTMPALPGSTIPPTFVCRKTAPSDTVVYEARFDPATGNRYYPPLILANHP